MVEHLWIVDIIAREAFLFAGVGLLIGGLDDLLVDLVFIGRSIWCRRTVRPCLRDLPAPLVRAPLAIFVPAWDEVAVIGAMLATSVARFEHEDYRIYVGAYPNDRATIDAAAAAAACDPRITVVIGDHDGPTTKADCLNTLWHALRRSDAEAGRRTKAIVLHDAEDVVHPLELRVFDSLIDRYAVVQLPILPLVKRGARLVSGHYADEFAEAACTLPQLAMAHALPAPGKRCTLERRTVASAMGSLIERIFRFIEMIGITALIASIFGTVYPAFAEIAVGFLSAAASAYLVLPVYEYCRGAVSEGGTRRSQIVGSIVTVLLFLGVESLISYKVVLTTAKLINSKINPPVEKAPMNRGKTSQPRPS